MAKRLIVGVTTGTLAIAAFAVAPALGAPEAPHRVTRHTAAPLTVTDAFTPAAADPRLAAMFARGGLDGSEFRFTPADSRHNARSVTVAVRTRSSAPVTRVAERDVAASSPSVGLAPIAYNLGVAVGWRRFAMSGELAKVDLAGQPGSRQAVDIGVSYTAARFTGRVKAAADHALADAPRLTVEAPSYSLDVGGSYSLTRNLDVTAGMRYKTERERLQPVEDRRDSQAVYVGTAFRF